MIGQLQWCISLGRIDIFSACVTMSTFRIMPRIGHMEMIKRVYGYLCDTKHTAIRVRVDEPDYSNFPDQMHDWSLSIYGDVKEYIPDNLPEPLGNPIVLTHYADENLYHDMVTGRSLTSILHLMNQTPFS